MNITIDEKNNNDDKSLQSRGGVLRNIKDDFDRRAAILLMPSNLNTIISDEDEELRDVMPYLNTIEDGEDEEVGDVMPYLAALFESPSPEIQSRLAQLEEEDERYLKEHDVLNRNKIDVDDTSMCDLYRSLFLTNAQLIEVLDRERNIMNLMAHRNDLLSPRLVQLVPNIPSILADCAIRKIVHINLKMSRFTSRLLVAYSSCEKD